MSCADTGILCYGCYLYFIASAFCCSIHVGNYCRLSKPAHTVALALLKPFHQYDMQMQWMGRSSWKIMYEV